jgi:uncharacterized protein YoxC
VAVDGGQIAALIAAGAFLMLVIVVAVPILRLRHTIDAATRTLREVQVRTGPLLDNVHVTVDHVNTALSQAHVTLDGVNVQLAKVDTMTAHAAAATANVSNLISVVTAAAANPLVKAAAFGFGLRRANAARRGAEEDREVRDRLRGERGSRKGR